jgi:predicted molibdopterin-dependent oxidoreductase YjgC
MATLTVDGRTIEAPDGSPLVEALKNNGVYVSSLCYIDGLKPYAGCRSCLVDIEGPPGLQLSCTAVVQDGMVVRTETDEVREARKAVVSIILANHSDRCLTCHRREHCHPGDICLRDDVVTHRCLTCSKNYRCELQATCEMVGMSGYEPWVGEERSWYQVLQPPADRANPFMEFDPQMCIICTRCQRACDEKRHTGAITLGGKGWETRIAFGAGGAIHESNCDFSGACIDVCPTAALMEHPNKWVAKPETWTTTTCDSCAVGCSIRLGTKDGQGVIVRPGTGNDFSGDQICVRGRYHYDSLKPRERLSRHLVRRGNIHAPVSFDEAILEAAEALKRAAVKGRIGVLVGGTATNEEAWLAATIARDAFKAAADSATGPVLRAVKAALEERLGGWRMATAMNRLPTAKRIVVVADDLEESHNVASVRIKDAVVTNGAQLVVIGALRSELVDFAAAWLRPQGGEEGQLADELADALSGSGTANTSVAAAAELLRGATLEDTVVVCAPNPVSPSAAGAMAGGAANVAVALFGNEASNALLVFPPDANSHGLLDMGVATEGGANPLEGLAGLLVIRDDPTMKLPEAAAGLEELDALVVIDTVLSETAKLSSVVLADSRAYSSEGTYTAADLRIQRLARALGTIGDDVPAFTSLRALGAALGVALPDTPDAVLGAIAGTDPRYQAAHDLIIGEGVRPEVPPTGTGTLVPVAAATVSGEGLRLIASRDLYTAADASALRHPEAEKLHRYDRFQVSEQDGARLGLKDGDELELSTGGASLRAKVTITERVPEGSVYVSSLLQGGVVSQLFDGSGAIPLVRAGVAVTA